jgi:hypothetical protein
VVDNEQLKYALGALLEVLALGHKVETVTSMVVQPRYEGANPVRSETFKAVELLDFAADMQEAAERTRLPNPPLVAGDHCKFCPKRARARSSRSATTRSSHGRSRESCRRDRRGARRHPAREGAHQAIEEHAYKLACRASRSPAGKLVDKEAAAQVEVRGRRHRVGAEERRRPVRAARSAVARAAGGEDQGHGAARQEEGSGKVLEPFYDKQSAAAPRWSLITDDRPGGQAPGDGLRRSRRSSEAGSSSVRRKSILKSKGGRA